MFRAQAVRPENGLEVDSLTASPLASGSLTLADYVSYMRLTARRRR
jgi:hypothetical protein